MFGKRAKSVEVLEASDPDADGLLLCPVCQLALQPFCFQSAVPPLVEAQQQF